MTGELNGKRILVTGGATGIGAAAVSVLSAAGAGLAATYHRTPPPDGSGVAWLCCDATEQESVDQAFGEAVQTLGGLDVLVHAAGLWHPGVPGQIGKDDVRHATGTNFTSTVLANQAAAAIMGDGPASTNLRGRRRRPDHQLRFQRRSDGQSDVGRLRRVEGGGRVLDPIATSAVSNLAGGDTLMSASRSPVIMADAAVAILTKPAAEANGQCFVDADVLTASGVTDLSRYGGGDDPMWDIFLDKL
jgi:NAD(P)-dependent dehydrogenase (short-subunit alcohol dehydrogenase family)